MLQARDELHQGKLVESSIRHIHHRVRVALSEVLHHMPRHGRGRKTKPKHRHASYTHVRGGHATPTKSQHGGGQVIEPHIGLQILRDIA